MTLDMKKYCEIDLSVLIILAVVTQLMGQLLSQQFPEANYYLNFSILVGMLAIIRWGYLGSIVYIIAGFAMFFISDVSAIKTLLLYPFANAFIILAINFFKIFKVEKLKENNLILILFIITVFVSVSIGKGVAAFLLGEQLLPTILYYLTINLFNIVMVFIVLQLIKNREGLLIKFI